MTAQKSKNAPPPPASKQSFMLIGALAIVGAGIMAYLVLKPKGVSIPANVAVLAADTAGFRGYVIGSENAPIEVTEYADIECPACAHFDVIDFPVVRKQLIDAGLIRYRFRDYPLDGAHRHTRIASHAAACANDQGKFWEMKARLFETQGDWSPRGSVGGYFSNIAKEVGLDQAAYDECMASAKYAGRIEASLKEGMAVGVGSTPTFLVEGRLYPGALPSDSLASLVRNLIAAKGQ
ncbi:MAG: DsbA family protein [Gemmatimonadales bacterium]